MKPVSDLSVLLQTMQPTLNPGTFAFVCLPEGKSIPADAIIASIRETEGLSVVVEESVVYREGLRPEMLCAWITLTVHSDLHAVGLTAAFAAALGGAGISCNVVAGAKHDHIFVPIDRAQAAMQTLRKLQSDSR